MSNVKKPDSPLSKIEAQSLTRSSSAKPSCLTVSETEKLQAPSIMLLSYKEYTKIFSKWVS